MKLIGDSIDDVITAAELAKHGSWPIAGGWMDQTDSCVESVRQFWREEDYWKARMTNG